MYLRAKKRIKDGKEHRYWSIVESCRNLDGRVVQRQVLYLGEINDGQKAAWCRTIDVLQTDSSAKQMALFPTDRQAPELDCEVVQVKLNEIRLGCRPQTVTVLHARVQVRRCPSGSARACRWSLCKRYRRMHPHRRCTAVRPWSRARAWCSPPLDRRSSFLPFSVLST